VPMQNLVLYNRPPDVPSRCPVANIKTHCLNPQTPSSPSSSWGGILKKKTPLSSACQQDKREEDFVVKRESRYLHNETPTFSCFSS
jgi:hypothetical protein